MVQGSKGKSDAPYPSSLSSKDSLIWPGGRALMSALTLTPKTGWCQRGATSASGNNTKARSCKRGWGSKGHPPGALTWSPWASRSRSRVRGALGAPRRRPKSSSIRCKSVSNASGARSVPTRATPFMYQGLSEAGSGALRYHRETLITLTPAASRAGKAARQAASGVPQCWLGRLAPMATTITGTIPTFHRSYLRRAAHSGFALAAIGARDYLISYLCWTEPVFAVPCPLERFWLVTLRSQPFE